MKKPILVTGATGFVGRHLLQALASIKERERRSGLASLGEPVGGLGVAGVAAPPSKEEGQEIRPIALVREIRTWKSYDWTRELASVEVMEGSVTTPRPWINDPRLEGLSGIFHLAAVVRHSRKDPEELYKTNVEGLLQMVRLAAAHRCRVVFVSTSGTVGCFRTASEWADEESPYCEEEVHSWPYYDSKIQAERRARKLAEEQGVELVIIRAPVLLGPGDHRSRATGHILRLLQGKLPFLLRGGIHFIDIRDATEALLRAMRLPNPRSVYHLVGTSCSIDEFFKMVEEISGVPPPRLHLPLGLARIAAKALPMLPDPVVFEMASRYWNVRSRYSQELGFSPRDPRQTISDTVQWLREHHEGLKPSRYPPSIRVEVMVGPVQKV